MLRWGFGHKGDCVSVSVDGVSVSAAHLVYFIAYQCQRWLLLIGIRCDCHSGTIGLLRSVDIDSQEHPRTAADPTPDLPLACLLLILRVDHVSADCTRSVRLQDAPCIALDAPVRALPRRDLSFPVVPLPAGFLVMSLPFVPRLILLVRPLLLPSSPTRLHHTRRGNSVGQKAQTEKRRGSFLGNSLILVN